MGETRSSWKVPYTRLAVGDRGDLTRTAGCFPSSWPALFGALRFRTRRYPSQREDVLCSGRSTDVIPGSSAASREPAVKE